MIKPSTVKMFRCEFETLIPKWGEGSSSSLLQIWIFCVFVFTISRYEWKVNRIFKSKMKKIFKPSNYLENYSSCVVYVPSCAVCISTLASSTVTSNQHTNKTSNYVHYHQEIQARVHYTEDVQHVKLCETWASFGQVIFSQVLQESPVCGGWIVNYYNPL